MNKLFATLLLVFSYLVNYAQGKIIDIEISREDYAEIEIVSDDEQFILTSSPNNLSNEVERYELDRGKGGFKDVHGYKERTKLYLKNGQNDTLAIIFKKEDKVLINNITLTRKKSENGWQFLTDDGINYCSVQLFWNKTKWKYSLSFLHEDKVAKVLEKVVMLSMIDLAIEESHCDGEDTLLSSLPHILYLLSLLPN